MRSGHSLRAALLATTRSPDSSLGRTTQRLALLLDRGAEPAGALRRLGEELPPDDPIGSTLLVVAVAARLGGPLAVPLDRVAASLRVRAADEAERIAHSAQARLSAHVLTALPAGFLTLMSAVDADVRATITTVPGAPIVGVGVALDLLGGWWMRRIVRGSGA
jgi:tight adherence protein B